MPMSDGEPSYRKEPEAHIGPIDAALVLALAIAVLNNRTESQGGPEKITKEPHPIVAMFPTPTPDRLPTQPAQNYTKLSNGDLASFE